MHQLLKGVCLGTMLSIGAGAAEPVPGQPWASRDLSVETGLIGEIGTGTPITYRLWPTQFSWRSKAALDFEFSDGSRIVVRHRLTLLGTYVLHGPESHYVAIMASPSIEWWNPAGTWSLFAGSGGGFGLLDSRGVKGGQGQDFTLTWFIRGGLEHVISPHSRLTAGILYEHMSNGGQTKPNPGIDALGGTLGYSWVY